MCGPFTTAIEAVRAHCLSSSCVGRGRGVHLRCVVEAIALVFRVLHVEVEGGSPVREELQRVRRFFLGPYGANSIWNRAVGTSFEGCLQSQPCTPFCKCMILKELVALTGIERVNPQYNPVQLRLTSSLYVKLGSALWASTG